MSRRWIVWVRNIVVALVVAAFVIVFGQPGAGPTIAPVAEVDGEEISRELFEFFREQNASLLQEVAQDLDPGTLGDFLDRQTLEGLVRRTVVTRQATDLGLWVGGEEIRSRIVSDPNFRNGGRFDPEIFERFVVYSGLETPRIYTQEVGKDLLLQKLQRAVASPIRVSSRAAEETARRLRTQVSLRLALARPEDFARQIEIPDEEVSAFAEEDGGRIERAYQDRIDEFVQPEQIRARHILFKGEDASDRAAKALKRLEAGEDFVELAQELSEDLATKNEGGDLGFFPKGRMLPTFEQSAFALETGTVSGPVETPRGVHLIRVEERREGVERTLEEVRGELARDLLLEDRARTRAREVAEQTMEAIRGGSPFVEAAEAGGLDLQTTPLFTWTQLDVPGIGKAPELRAAAFALSPDRPTPSRVFDVRDGYALISLLERQEPDEDELRLETQQIREERTQELRTRVMARWYDSRRKELEADGRLRIFALSPTR